MKNFIKNSIAETQPSSPEAIGPTEPPLSKKALEQALRDERKWLNENNAISEVTGGPVEDQEGIPLPADLHQGTPETPHEPRP